jgi:hypothetical protein
VTRRQPFARLGQPQNKCAGDYYGVPLVPAVTSLGGQAGRGCEEDRDAVSEHGRQEPGRRDEQAGDDGRHAAAEVSDDVDGGEQAGPLVYFRQRGDRGQRAGE